MLMARYSLRNPLATYCHRVDLRITAPTADTDQAASDCDNPDQGEKEKILPPPPPPSPTIYRRLYDDEKSPSGWQTLRRDSASATKAWRNSIKQQQKTGVESGGCRTRSRALQPPSHHAVPPTQDVTGKQER
ncbi:assimilatory nitrate reductase [Anopheles sinensis]|uniref:Assimilatory nitrate reductase n=1 Tax=Anopheles sinensis TaxID=74873 RepID=A0A084VQP1_ANOSI|nr:assimilatory nitrate reductase [Anopheles sinensis]